MTMIAIISDVHANLEALEAVLADIDSQKDISAIYCLGELVGYGPDPVGVIDLVDVELDGPVDATAFFYQPATEGLIDITEPYNKMLGLMRP